MKQLPILQAATKRFEMRRNVRHLGSLALVFISAWLWPGASAQELEDRKPEKPRPTGVATGAPHAPVKDAMSRPITAGGFVDGAPIVFIDITKQAGLGKFHHRSGAPEKATILETPGSGVALLDYDNDGWLDIYLLNGSTFAALKGREPAPRAMLLRNNHDGTFEDVTSKAGVANERWGFGVAVGDYDNDGWPDLYVANWGTSRLYHNNGNGTFTDVADKLGVARKGWSTWPSWGDFDADGRLDLFVPGYLDIDLNNLPKSPADANKPGEAGQNFCQFRGVPVMCGPPGLPGESDTLYHQKLDGNFEDVSV